MKRAIPSRLSLLVRARISYKFGRREPEALK
jgi:hypothetical protein